MYLTSFTILVSPFLGPVLLDELPLAARFRPPPDLSEVLVVLVEFDRLLLGLDVGHSGVQLGPLSFVRLLYPMII
jgi:hypothetical protein